MLPPPGLPGSRDQAAEVTRRPGLDGSPSPAAAKLFLRWLLEPDQQNAIAQGGAWSPRLDIAPPPGLAPLAELNVANGFPAFITRTADAQGYRDRFAALIGPVTGPEYR
jgi:ABC-type Fe3+ transport system substrate-binding protein